MGNSSTQPRQMGHYMSLGKVHSLTLHILSTIIVICLSVKMGFDVVEEAEEEDEVATAVSLEGPAADMAADAALMTDASSIIGSGEDGGDDLSPEKDMEEFGGGFMPSPNGPNRRPNRHAAAIDGRIRFQARYVVRCALVLDCLLTGNEASLRY